MYDYNNGIGLLYYGVKNRLMFHLPYLVTLGVVNVLSIKVINQIPNLFNE